MHWENDTGDCPELAETEVPAELLDGLERLSADGDLLKSRLRWRPHQTAATGFLTKDRLLELRGEPIPAVARALASLAHHLYEQGGCEPKFEAQIQRELEAEPEGRREREWRSITFYVNQPPSSPTYASYDVRDDDTNDDNYGSSNYPSSWQTSPAPPRPPAIPNYADYAGFIELSRTDPTAFAMIVMQQSCDRTVSILEGLLGSSVTRLDRVLGTQISSTRYLNEALQTLTKGANEVAKIGVDLFHRGLEGQARVARMEHETELGKERTELMRDAVKHGSLLVQAVLMSQQAKQQRTAQTPAPGAAAPPTPSASATWSPPPPPPSASAPSSSPPSAPASTPPSTPPSVDDEIEIKARHLLEIVSDDVLERLRGLAPSLAGMFDTLRAQPVTADRVRAVIHEAQTTVDPAELAVAGQAVDPEVTHALGILIMRVLSEDRP